MGLHTRRNEASLGWHTAVPEHHPAARLLAAGAVRERCGRIMAAAERGETTYFTWHPEHLDRAADYVVATIRQRYPDLNVPYHSRWRHFEAGGADRWRKLADIAGLSGAECARSRIDLVIPSVLLDAGAGLRWSYADSGTGMTLARSEGLAVASLALFSAGFFSADPARPLRADAIALMRVETATLAAGFQASAANPLVGIEARAELLRRLGAVATATPAVFGAPARLGNLLDYLLSHATAGAIPAQFLLATLLRALGPVWPSRIVLDGIPLGDCWHHPAASGNGPDDPTAGLVPFHKLTQWLAYSLLEPLAEAGLAVSGIDQLTGLPEYRNGGLLIDLGVLQPRAADVISAPLSVDHPAVVEWRALTVSALDRLANAVRAQLNLDATAFPLARVLEGGTWAAGRRIAAELRGDASPPLNVVSDGTVF
jgi:hypothetical protein